MKEDKNSYYYLNGKKQYLEREPRIFGIKFKPGRLPRDISDSKENVYFVNEESEQVDFIPEFGLQVFYTERNKAHPDRLQIQGDVVRAVQKLNQENVVQYATIAYKRNPEAQTDHEVSEVMFASQMFLAKFKDKTTQEQIHELFEQYNVTVTERLGYAENGYMLEAPDAEGDYGPVALANEFVESGLVEWAHPNFIQKRHIRVEKTVERKSTKKKKAEAPAGKEARRFVRENFLEQQWHLKTAKITEAWKITKGVAAVQVAIMDDGIDIQHDEFNGKITAEYDFATNSEDASPKTASDKHGTACAGVALAGGIKCFGSAPECSLIAIRMGGFYDFATQAKMFQWAADEGADIISCSWGPPDGIGSKDPIPDNIRSAIDYCVQTGRKGKGIPVFFAAGNGSESVSDDGWASYKNVIAIAASTNKETKAWYSDTGPELAICAPSSGDTSVGEKQIFTTDRLGSSGYNAGNTGNNPADAGYTSTFGGTSSSAPLVAGVAGLMLSVNRGLNRNQVLQILKESADKIDEDGGNYQNGHSTKYGYGRINAEKAVKKAKEMKDTGSAGNDVVDNSSKPSVSAAAEISEDSSSPSFQINKGGRKYFALELATRPELFDAANYEDERNQDNFYGSWVVQLESGNSYTLPSDVWNSLKKSSRLYYRLHVADNNQWDNYDVTITDSNATNAPFIKIGSADIPETPEMPEEEIKNPSIKGPQSIPQSSTAPEFEINKADRKLYAVEVATDKALFNAEENQDERSEHNFYGSWQDSGLQSASTYQLPEQVWNKLKQAERLYYRAHFADDNQWANYAVSIADSNYNAAPSIKIAINGNEPAFGAEQELIFPSGNKFPIEENPSGNIDYHDHVANNAIPLIKIQGRYEEKLSKNFTIKELASRDKPPYARISVELVEKLQLLRDTLSKPLIINSAYRHKAFNDANGGANSSQHIAGRGADIRVKGMAPLELAQKTLEVFGCNIGIGLGKNIVHVDLRGQMTNWVYEGAVMGKQEFKEWVQQQCQLVNRFIARSLPRKQPELKLSVSGPETYFVHNNLAPSFTVTTPGTHPYFAMEIAEAPHLLLPDYEKKRSNDNFYASWQVEGLKKSKGNTIYYMPAEVWNRFRAKDKLFYRVMASQNQEGWDRPVASVKNEDISNTPWITLKEEYKTLKNIEDKQEMSSLKSGITKQEEELWNKETQS